jgi:hypothetical protein
VFIVPEEKSAYIKIDSKVTSRPELEADIRRLLHRHTDKQPGGGDYSTDQEYCLRIEVTKDCGTGSAESGAASESPAGR